MKKTFKKRAFISAIAMLIVSAIVLTSATYAWFSMAKKVEVSGLNLDVTSPEGIQISANTSAFTTKLTVENITGSDESAAGKRFNAYEGHTNNIPTTVKPSSSTFITNGNLPTWFDGSINDQGKMDIYAVNEADKNHGFVAFDLFVKVKEATTVKFGSSSVTCEGNTELPAAMRIAIVNCGTVSKDATYEDIQNTHNIINSALNRKVIYEMEPYKHTSAAKAAGGIDDNTYVATKGINTVAKNVTCNSTYNNIIDSYTLDLSATIAKTAADAKINVGKDITRLRVYIWMEGNDIDCANDVAGSLINCNLVLEID